MTIDQISNGNWTRKHDKPGTAIKAPKILFPKSLSLKDLIEICSTRKPSEFLKAAGSHWALSEAAISDNIFIETHDPNNKFTVMGRTLYDVVPGCLNKQILDVLGNEHPKPFDKTNISEDEGTYLVHFETGKRIYQLYSELDLGDDDNKKSLAWFIKEKYNNSDYLGPWTFQTLGGAGGQTVFGALTTGTHGGDFKYPPIADSVLALHLVADGGNHYWIEPKETEVQLTDDNKLKALYGGVGNFGIIRDDNVFNSVLISAGRFGIVYSIVMRAVRQYSLHEERRLSTWQNIKNDVLNSRSTLYDKRFLQIVICATPHKGFHQNACGITKRWNVGLAGKPFHPNGRDERRGDVLKEFDTRIQGPRFKRAGNSFPYRPDPDKENDTLPPSFLEIACSNASFIEGIVDAIIVEFERFIREHKVIAGGIIAAVTLNMIGVSTLLALIPALIIVVKLLKAFHKYDRLGQAMNDLRDKVLNGGGGNPAERLARVFAWQTIAFGIFKFIQDDINFEAISYAVMDGHNYRDKSCNVNVDSIEVFFDATHPMLIAFVDALLVFEARQEFLEGKAFVGYIALRFTSKTRALIGMEKYPLTCAVEVSGLKDVTGTKELIDYAISLSRNRNFRGILHWGQRNESTITDIQDRFGDDPIGQSGSLRIWRNTLSRITGNGRLNGFSSKFTRRVGLEIVTPVIQLLKIDPTNPSLNQSVIIIWNCNDNPPSTEVKLNIQSPTMKNTDYSHLSLIGQQPFTASELGEYIITLTAIIQLNEVRKTSNQVVVIVK
jgi:hypothetical protein